MSSNQITLPNNINVELHNDGTATVVKSPDSAGEIVIQKSVKHENKEYIITNIGTNAFKNNNNVKSIKFTEDSEIRKFCKFSFDAYLSSLYLPPLLEELESGWCLFARGLVDLTLSPKNKHFIYQNGLLMDPEKTIIYFVRRDLVSATVPKTVKVIGDYAFSHSRVKSVTFENNSHLEIVGFQAFNNCMSIQSIYFPPLLKSFGRFCFSMSSIGKIECDSENIEIQRDCFQFCKKLSNVSFRKVKKLTIEDSAFKDNSRNFVLTVLEGADIQGEGIPKSIKCISQEDMDFATSRAQKEKENLKNVQDIEGEVKIDMSKPESAANIIDKIPSNIKDIEIENAKMREILNTNNGQYDFKIQNIEVLNSIHSDDHSDVVKVIDKVNGKILCKKTVHGGSYDVSFLNTLMTVRSCCICSLYGYNVDVNNKITQTSFFLEFLYYIPNI